jgi:hypothetical protein
MTGSAIAVTGNKRPKQTAKINGQKKRPQK